MNDQLRTTVTIAARHAAQLEAALQAATDRHGKATAEATALRSRIDATDAQIQALRSTAAVRDLSEKEAAALNVAMLDLADLRGLGAEAETRCQEAAAGIAPAQKVLQAARQGLEVATARVHLEMLAEKARADDAALCTTLMELWKVRRIIDPHARFVSAWTPSDPLRRAAVDNQPPDGSIS